MKKLLMFLALITATVTLAVFASTAVGAADVVVYTGAAGESATWTLRVNPNSSDSFGRRKGTLIFSGSGEVAVSASQIAGKHNAVIESVKFESGITSIAQYSFSGLNECTSITLPSTLKTIGKEAFLETAIRSIVIPSGVTEIGANAFGECTGLSSVYIASPTVLKY